MPITLSRGWRLLKKGKQAQETPASARTPLPQPLYGRKQPNHPSSQEPKPPPPPHPTPNDGSGERRSHEREREGHPLSTPNVHAPLTQGWGGGFQLPKKPRWRGEGSEAQHKGQSLKGETYGVHYNISLKKLSTAPQTNPQKCHKSHRQCTSYLDTLNTLEEVP